MSLDLTRRFERLRRFGAPDSIGQPTAIWLEDPRQHIGLQNELNQGAMMEGDSPFTSCAARR
jgi:hypothetical protein